MLSFDAFSLLNFTAEPQNDLQMDKQSVVESALALAIAIHGALLAVTSQYVSHPPKRFHGWLMALVMCTWSRDLAYTTHLDTSTPRRKASI